MLIQIGKDSNTLIITVVERPSISAIELSGNKALKTEQLLESLDGVGIKEGEVYKRSTLEKVKSELIRSYASNGRYGAGVEINEIIKPRNRIEINIEVDEGNSAKIEKIIIGKPVKLNNKIHALENEIVDFIESINRAFPNISIHRVDERFTSKISKKILNQLETKKKIRMDKSIIDKISASLILESYLIKTTK